MWWCCGKPKLTSAGCKFQKHTSKEDIEEDDEGNVITEKIIKCLMCKEIGHKATECDKDPNVRTFFDVGDEIARVEKVMTKKKKLTDNVSVTFNLLERMALLSNERLTNRVLG